MLLRQAQRRLRDVYLLSARGVASSSSSGAAGGQQAGALWGEKKSDDDGGPMEVSFFLRLLSLRAREKKWNASPVKHQGARAYSLPLLERRRRRNEQRKPHSSKSKREAKLIALSLSPFFSIPLLSFSLSHRSLPLSLSPPSFKPLLETKVVSHSFSQRDPPKDLASGKRFRRKEKD
jgi:hypothetical protein